MHGGAMDIPNTQWFKEQILRCKTSQRQLARKLGIDPASLSLMLRGRRKMQLQEVDALAKNLMVTRDEILKNVGIERDADAVVPVVGFLDSDFKFLPYKSIDKEAINRPSGVGADAYAIRFQTARTKLQSIDAWILFLEKSQSPTTAIIGSHCLLKRKDGSRCLAFIQSQGYKKGTYNLLVGLGVEALGEDNVQIVEVSKVKLIQTQREL
jgi:transcriptional regulator with XRE-family HTH domain